jgi:hypothetical protein
MNSHSTLLVAGSSQKAREAAQNQQWEFYPFRNENVVASGTWQSKERRVAEGWSRRDRPLARRASRIAIDRLKNRCISAQNPQKTGPFPSKRPRFQWFMFTFRLTGAFPMQLINCDLQRGVC